MIYYQTDLAYVHDTGHSELAHRAATHLSAELVRQGRHQGLIIDLGCGSGILAEIMARQGYEVHGIDYSEDLIAIARRRAPEATFVADSLFSAELPEGIAYTAIGEVFNYAFDERNNLDQLGSLFQKIFRRLPPGGLLLFDTAGPGLLGTVSTQRIVEAPEWAMFLDYEEDTATSILTRKITLFRKAGELYRRSQEIHRLRLYDPSVLQEMLEETGFIVNRIDHYASLRFRDRHSGFLAVKKQAGK